MSPIQPKGVAEGLGRPETPSRADIEALRSLLALDEEIAARAGGAAGPPPAEPTGRLGPSAALRDRRLALASRLPLEALEIYEDALRRGLRPAAVATRGRVCWGCFHSLSPNVVAAFLSDEVFLGCPHCERLLFNPDWKVRR
jgi:hypothetical protein